MIFYTYIFTTTMKLTKEKKNRFSWLPSTVNIIQISTVGLLQYPQ